MKKKLFAITLCALIAAASIVGSTGFVDQTNIIAHYAFGDKSGGY